MHPRSAFVFKPDFKPHNRSPSFLHHFLCFKTWLVSNWSHELIYNVYSINRILWYRVWPTRFLTRFASSWSHQFKTYEIQPSPQTISCDYGEGVWSVNLINHGSDCSILFLDRKLFLHFSPKLLNHFVSSSSYCVFLFVLFLTVYNMWIFIAWEHYHHFRILDSGKTRTVAIYCSKMRIFEFSSSLFWFLIGAIQLLIFLISLLILNYFSKIHLFKLYPKNLKKSLKCNKIYGNFYLSFFTLIKYQLIFLTLDQLIFHYINR
jgi:hypothetical protein